MLRRLGAFFLDILEVIVFALAIFLTVYLLILRPHKIKGASMEPNFPNAEYLLTEKVSYYRSTPQRGDVIVFKPPVSEDDEFIKRVIGLPGEKISLKNGKIYINERLLKELYLQDDILTYGSTFLSEGNQFQIPEGTYFVLGDNRPYSSDSRTWGPIQKDKISGHAWLIYWPLNKVGSVKRPIYDGF